MSGAELYLTVEIHPVPWGYTEEISRQWTGASRDEVTRQWQTLPDMLKDLRWQGWTQISSTAQVANGMAVITYVFKRSPDADASLARENGRRMLS